jgi:hypothetical protein
MAQAFFIILVAGAAIFFIWRMRIDPLAVAFGSSAVYFTPGLFGVAQFTFGRGPLDSYSEPIVPGAYAAMALVLVVLTTVTLVADRIPVGRRISLGFESRIPMVFIVFAIVFGAISVYDTGVYYLCSDKFVVLSKIDTWYYLASISVPFAVATAYSQRQWLLVAIGALGLFADLYAGFRAGIAITFLACAMLMEDWIYQGWRKVVAFAAIILVGGAALFVVKHLITPLKYATVSYCNAQIALDAKSAASSPKAPTNQEGNRAVGGTAKRDVTPQLSMGENLNLTAISLSQPKFYFSAFVVQSEAFVIQSTLNEVVRKEFHTDAYYLIGQVLAGLPLGASVFEIDSTKVISFNAMVQPALFPRVRDGMANNPWAQAYAAGGQWMVVAFALGYAAIVAMVSLLFRKTTGSLRATVAVIGAWTAFYFHRNDLFIEAILIKHVVYVCGASMLLAWLYDLATAAAQNARRSSASV